MKVVVDTSILASPYLGEPGWEAVTRALDEIEICAPMILRYELWAVVGRNLKTRGLPLGPLMERVWNLSVTETTPDRAWLQVATELVEGQGLAFYDACFVATAIGSGLPLWTADRKMLEAAQRKNVSLYDPGRHGPNRREINLFDHVVTAVDEAVTQVLLRPPTIYAEDIKLKLHERPERDGRHLFDAYKPVYRSRLGGEMETGKVESIWRWSLKRLRDRIGKDNARAKDAVRLLAEIIGGDPEAWMHRWRTATDADLTEEF